MGDSFIHENTFALIPFWENLLQHKDGVQFIHRSLAILLALALLIYVNKNYKKASIQLSKSLKAASLILIAQFLLGVFTLILRVPVSLGVLHQLGAIILLISLFRIYFFQKFTSQVDLIG